MNWTDEKIVEWHKKTFPDCTYESQLEKLDEELKEVSEAQKKEITNISLTNGQMCIL